MIDLKCLRAVSERDIDMVLVEELQSSKAFREWVATKVFGSDSYKEKLGAWHSVSDPSLGESDIIFLFANTTDGTTAVLIENKISASAQPDQGNRYQKRGIAGQKNGWWDEFKTCLIAPEKYLHSVTQTQTYDVEISYEAIQSYFVNQQESDERFKHKALVVEEAILQNRRGYQPEIDSSLSQFVQDYYAFAIDNYPEVGIDFPKPRPGGSTWIAFHPDCLPESADIAHQTTAGFVKLFFRGSAELFESLKNKYQKQLPDGTEIVITGKSVAIITKVPKIRDPHHTAFENYTVEANAALRAIANIILAVQQSN